MRLARSHRLAELDFFSSNAKDAIVRFHVAWGRKVLQHRVLALHTQARTRPTSASLVVAGLVIALFVLASITSILFPGGSATAQSDGQLDIEQKPSYAADEGRSGVRDFAEGKLIVKTSAESGKQQLRTLNQRTNTRVLTAIPEGNLKVLELGDQMSVREAQQRYESQPSIEYAEPDYKIYPTDIKREDRIDPQYVTPDDPLFAELYGLNNQGQTGGTSGADISATDAWEKTTGSDDVVVAVIDTGINIDHPDLRDNIWINEDEVASNNTDDDGNGYKDDVTGWNFYDDNNKVFGDAENDSHGTHIAGTIGAEANNGQGVAGVNHDVKIMPLKFIGPESGNTSDAIEAIHYAVENGATISNSSWGGGERSQALEDTLSYAERNDHLFVAAAGNESENADITPFYPASYQHDNVVSVAATDDDDDIADFSNYGANSIDLGAPGVEILSTFPPGLGSEDKRPYGYLSGTSMASPHVAGTAALLKSEYPGASEEDLKIRLLESVDPVTSLQGDTVTGGRLNADRALSRDTIPSSESR